MDLTRDYSRVSAFGDILEGHSMVIVRRFAEGNERLSIDIGDGVIFDEFKNLPPGRELFKLQLRKLIKYFGLNKDDGYLFNEVIVLIEPKLIRDEYGELALEVVVDSLPFMDNFMLFDKKGARNNIFVFVPYPKEKQELEWRPDEVIPEDFYA